MSNQNNKPKRIRMKQWEYEYMTNARSYLESKNCRILGLRLWYVFGSFRCAFSF